MKIKSNCSGTSNGMMKEGRELTTEDEIANAFADIFVETLGGQSNRQILNWYYSWKFLHSHICLMR